MTSLSEAYGGRGAPRSTRAGCTLVWARSSPERCFSSSGLFVAAEVVLPSGYSSGEARRLGGVLGGVGVPSCFSA